MPDTHAPQRFTTTVPQQALFLMNSPFVIEQARALAARTSQPRSNDAGGRTVSAGLRRQPTADETVLALGFVESPPPEGTKLSPWEQLAQVLLVSNEFAFVD